MKTYHFATPTPSYGIVHTVVTCNHPTEAEDFLDEREIKESPTTIQRHRALNDEIEATLTWELFTVKPVEKTVWTLDTLLQAKTLQPLSMGDAFIALGEMKIQQDIVVAEQQAVHIAFTAKQAAFTMKMGGVDPRSLPTSDPRYEEYSQMQIQYSNAILNNGVRYALENQRELTQMALENLDQVINAAVSEV